MKGFLDKKGMYDIIKAAAKRAAFIETGTDYTNP
jgi:hypothetical protein